MPVLKIIASWEGFQKLMLRNFQLLTPLIFMIFLQKMSGKVFKSYGRMAIPEQRWCPPKKKMNIRSGHNALFS